MDMSNVKVIFDNNVQKNVKKITDAEGNIIWYKVPDGYRKVEYIETNGTNYIDPILKVNNIVMFEFEAKWERLSLAEFSALFWYRTQESNNYPSIMCLLNYASANDDRFRMANYANGKTSTNSVPNTSGTNTVYYKTTGNRYNLNGTYYTYTQQDFNYSNMPNVDFYFPARYLSGTDTVHQFYAVRIYFFNIYSKTTGKPIRLFVPAKEDATGKVGMLELLSGIFYERQGTGEFGYRENGIVVQPT